MVTNMSSKSYSEMIMLPTFEERFNYLKLGGKIGEETFGFSRYINQEFYHLKEWKAFRDKVIIRDNGCDLAMSGYDILGKIIIHHINPITYEDIVNRHECVFDMNNVITTQLATHNAIHYGDDKIFINKYAQRYKNDTCPWRVTKKEEC